MTRRSAPRLAALLVGLLLVAACTEVGGGGQPSPTGAPASPAVDGFDPGGCPTAEPAALAAGQTRTVTITTELGVMALKIEADLSPIAAGNFVALAECGWYDGVVFHRVVPEFVIQGGDGENGRSPNVNSALVGTGGHEPVWRHLTMSKFIFAVLAVSVSILAIACGAPPPPSVPDPALPGAPAAPDTSLPAAPTPPAPGLPAK